MKINQKMTFTYADKLLLNREKDLTFMYTCENLGFHGKFVANLLEDVVAEKNGWRKFQSLTKREKEILKLVATGYSNRKIGELLFNSDLTVKTHRKNIMQKLSVKNLVELIRMADAMELLDEYDQSH